MTLTVVKVHKRSVLLDLKLCIISYEVFLHIKKCLVNSPKNWEVVLTLGKKIQYNVPVSILKRLRKEKDMDYIKRVIGKICRTNDNPETENAKSKEMNTAKNTFNSFVKSATSLAVCGLLVVAVAAAVDDKGINTNDTIETTEATSEDGSAPGQHLAGLKTETEQIKSDEGITESEIETSTEITTEQHLASKEEVTEQIVADNEYVISFSEEEYEVLCTIVEAEAGDQDEKGKILVANVILNRVRDEEFPDNIKDVVFQKSKKTYQFSPTRPGGRYYRVTPTENTIECVERALKGEDYSEGAIYFAMKTSSRSWFNTSLDFLFKHGDHYFYKDYN